MSDDNEIKDTFTAEELLEEIRKQEPDYDPYTNTNIQRLRPAPDISDIQPLTMTELKLMPVKPLEYVFYPCLPTQGICFIYAATGLGKTLFSLNLAYAIAQGGTFLNYRCPMPRRVLYVDGEMPFSQLHARLMQIAERQGELDFEDNLWVLTPDKIAPRVMPKMDEAYYQELYIKLIEKYNIEVIIFDNLSMLTSIDENKSNEWKIVQDFLLQLRAMGKSIIVIHHSGKDKNGYRGSSRMLDCADVAISLQPVSEDVLEADQIRGRKFKIVYQKARVFGGKDALPFEVNLENGFWTCRSMEKTEMDRIVELVGLKMNQRDIAREMMCSQSKVFKLIRKARDLRLIRD
jgi:archaellum biogenesis ATPase FlaH